MIDPLILQERIKNTISLGESHFREFKSAFDWNPKNMKPKAGNVKALCQYIGEALVAFANADGGDLLIGVEDDGVITGVPHGELEIKNMLAAHKTHIFANDTLPLLASQRVELEDKIVLIFSVDKGSIEIYQLPDGRCVRRKDKSTEPVKFEQIKFERQEVKSRQYDHQFVDGATVNDLDLPLLRTIADSYIKGLSVERYLQQIRLAEYGLNGLRLRMAALLLFAKDIQHWHPRSQVRILQVLGSELKSGENYNVISDETISGNIFELLERSWERLRPCLAYKTEFGSDAKFEQKYIYPELACREALINAIAHRDYSIQNGVDIFVFSNSLQMKSPGALLSTLTIKSLEKLENAHESRNASIMRVLRENSYVRELGEGMQRMFELMQEKELVKPTLYSNGLWFSVTFSHESVFNPQQQQWLSLFASFKLSTRQKRIIVLGMDNREISPKEISQALNTKELLVYTEETTFLRKQNILKTIMTNSDAAKYAKQHNVAKNEVKRFKVQIP